MSSQLSTNSLGRLKSQCPAYLTVASEYSTLKFFMTNTCSCKSYALRTVLNLGRSTEYKDCLRLASMDTLTQRRLTASLIMFFKAYRLQGASYISNSYSYISTFLFPGFLCEECHFKTTYDRLVWT